MAKSKEPQAPATETPPEASPEAPPAATISFDEPVSAADLTAGVADTPDKAIPVLNDAQMAELRRQAGLDDQKRDFMLKVLEARKPTEAEPAAPPELAPRVAEQTRLEMEAGRKLNEHHAGLAARRVPQAPPATEAQPVFRPADYVPDQKKGQGNVQVRNL